MLSSMYLGRFTMNDDAENAQDMAALLQRLRRQTRLQGLAILGLGALLVAGFAVNTDPQRLTVSELAVVDENGVVRVRVGGALPDAIIDGRRIGRGGEKVAGVMLYDDTGQERGGYVTFSPSGNVGLTLDSRRSQSALFVADPEEGVALKLWNGDDAVEMRADGDGARFTAVQGSRVISQTPAVPLAAEVCGIYREALAEHGEAVRRECSARFSPESCEVCLSD